MYNRMTKNAKFIEDTYIHFYSYRNKWFLTVSYYAQSPDDPEVAVYKTKSVECCTEEEGDCGGCNLPCNQRKVRW